MGHHGASVATGRGITVRYFAAAAEAAGVTAETFTTRSAASLVALMGQRHGPALQKVLERCSLLADGARIFDDETLLTDGVTVDVLPPFAGG